MPTADWLFRYGAMAAATTARKVSGVRSGIDDGIDDDADPEAIALDFTESLGTVVVSRVVV